MCGSFGRTRGLVHRQRPSCAAKFDGPCVSNTVIRRPKSNIFRKTQTQRQQADLCVSQIPSHAILILRWSRTFAQMNFNMPSFSMGSGLQGFEAPMSRAEAWWGIRPRLGPRRQGRGRDGWKEWASKDPPIGVLAQEKDPPIYGVGMFFFVPFFFGTRRVLGSPAITRSPLTAPSSRWPRAHRLGRGQSLGCRQAKKILNIGSVAPSKDVVREAHRRPGRGFGARGAGHRFWGLVGPAKLGSFGGMGQDGREFPELDEIGKC